LDVFPAYSSKKQAQYSPSPLLNEENLRIFEKLNMISKNRVTICQFFVFLPFRKSEIWTNCGMQFATV
jgi:hypothetical protein